MIACESNHLLSRSCGAGPTCEHLFIPTHEDGAYACSGYVPMYVASTPAAETAETKQQQQQAIKAAHHDGVSSRPVSSRDRPLCCCAARVKTRKKVKHTCTSLSASYSVCFLFPPRPSPPVSLSLSLSFPSSSFPKYIQRRYPGGWVLSMHVSNSEPHLRTSVGTAGLCLPSLVVVVVLLLPRSHARALLDFRCPVGRF